MTVEELGKKFKAKNPQYANSSDAEIGNLVLQKYPVYNQQIEKQSFLSKVGSALIQSEKRLGETLGQGFAAVTGTNKSIEQSNKQLQESGNKLLQIAQNTKDPKLKQQRLELAKSFFQQSGQNFQQILPASQKTNKQILGEAAGVATDVLSAGIGGGGKGGTSLGQNILRRAGQGALIGGGIGAAQGGSFAAQDNQSVVGGAIKGGLTGAATGGALGAAGGFVENKLVNRQIQQQQKQKDLVLKILRSKKESDVKIGIKELSKFDPKTIQGNNPLEDFSSAIQNKIDDLRLNVSETLTTDPTLYKPSNLTKVTQVGNTKVKQDFVKTALTRLQTELSKQGDDVAAEQARQLLTKYNKQGLTLSELNQVAIDWGKFGRNAFSKTGEPLTSVSAVESEKLRTGLKEVVRNTDIGKATTELDKQMSRLIRLKELTDSNIEKLNSAIARTEKLKLPLQLISKLRVIINPRQASGRIVSSIPVNDKAFTIQEANSNLLKNLKLLQKLNNVSDAKFLEMLKKLFGNKLFQGISGGTSAKLNQ